MSVSKYQDSDLNTAFYKSPDLKPTILLIHGWTKKGWRAWQKVIDDLEKERIGVIAIELPGFGSSQPPGEAWGAQEYSMFVKDFLTKIDFQPEIIAGHSFGGAIAMILSSLLLYEHKVCLCAPAIVRPPLTLRQHLIQQMSSIGSSILKIPGVSTVSPQIRHVWRKALGSQDYAETSGIMTSILSKVVREDLTAYLLPLKQREVTLVWGTIDTYTPFKFVNTIKAILPTVKVVPLSGQKHNLLSENAETVSSIIASLKPAIKI